MISDGPPPTAPPSRTGALQPVRDGVDRLLALVRGSPVRSGAVLGALLLIAVAGAPLADRAWEVFWSLPYAGRIVLCGIGLAVIVTATVRRSRLQLRQRAEQARLGSVIAVAWAVVIAVVGLLVAGAWWVMGAPTPTFPDPLPPRALDALATRAFAVVAGLGAAALLVIHYRRQRTTEADAIRAEAANVRAERAAEREVTKLFNERFTAAYTELGSEYAAVRLGAVHALAHLADDAPSEGEVQMVIDVLCAYLRMPYAPAPDPLPKNASKALRKEHRERELEFASFREVRHTIIRVIGNHLREPTRWRGKNYDFTGVVFDGCNLHSSVFSGGQVSFDYAQFIENAYFGDVEVSGGIVSFVYSTFAEADLRFASAKFTGGRTVFAYTKFHDGWVDFQGAEFLDGEVYFDDAVFSGGTVDFAGASGTCPSGLLEAMERGEPGVAVVSEHWQPTANGNGGQEGQATSADAPDH